MDRLWELCARPLTDLQRAVVERTVGLTGPPETLTDVASCADPASLVATIVNSSIVDADINASSAPTSTDAGDAEARDFLGEPLSLLHYGFWQGNHHDLRHDMPRWMRRCG